MKKVLALLTVLFILNGTFASVTVNKPPIKASEIFFPVGKSGQRVSLQELSMICVKDFQSITGDKMNFVERLAFKAAQKKLRNNIAADGTLNSKKLNKFFNKRVDGEGGFHVGGFILGLLLGLIGVIIAYIIKDDKRRSRRLWAWIGWGVWIALYLIFFL